MYRGKHRQHPVDTHYRYRINSGLKYYYVISSIFPNSVYDMTNITSMWAMPLPRCLIYYPIRLYIKDSNNVEHIGDPFGSLFHSNAQNPL